MENFRTPQICSEIIWPFDSEETIHSADINDTSYVPPSCFLLEKKNKISKWPTQKKVIFQLRQLSIFFTKISWIGPWVGRIDFCKGHWCGSTYMVTRLSYISLQTGQKCVFWPFWANVGQYHDHIGWATSMPFTSIQGLIHEIFIKKYLELLKVENDILFIIYLFSFILYQCKDWRLTNEVVFFLLCMVPSESWKRIHSIYYAHDCMLSTDGLNHQ